MSIAADLATAFAEIELTVPVQHLCTGAVTRGFLDRGVAMVDGDQLQSQAASDVLHTVRGSIPGIAVDDQLRIGLPGAVSVVGSDPLFVMTGPAVAHDDGVFDHFMLMEA